MVTVTEAFWGGWGLDTVAVHDAANAGVDNPTTSGTDALTTKPRATRARMTATVPIEDVRQSTGR
jgi:hypothetical protein